ncbi:MAG: hypothetical protein OXH73_17190 [Caldilineaceae bacterium]|nr:hypothetical protein [Caldilineaceae bacterium]
MLNCLHLYGRRLNLINHVDVGLSFALFLVGLAVYLMQWLALPPAIGRDAAELGLNAYDLLQENIFPFYVYHQFAPSPLIIYMQSFAVALFGYSIASLQVVTIVAGALAAPTTYWASRWLFEDQGTVLARRAGVIAALGLALSSFFASQSRRGDEPILLPVVAVVAVAFLWRGFRRGHKLDFVLAGLFVGLSQYAYIVARFFPVALALASAGAVLANHRLLAHWRGLIWAAASSVLVALPQWILFIAFPYTFVARVTVHYARPPGGSWIFDLPDPVTAFAAKLSNQLLTLCCYSNLRANLLTEKSLLPPIFVVGLVIGVVVVTMQRRDGHIFASLMMVLMFLPDLLTYEDMGDFAAIDHSRLVGGIPFIFVIAGLGTATIWARIENIRRLPSWIGNLVLALVLLSSLFRQWDFATQVRPQLLAQHGSSSITTQVVEYIGNQLDRPLLLPTSQYFPPQVAFLLAEHFPHRQAGSQHTLKHGEIVTAVVVDPERSMEDGFPEEWVLLRDKTVYFLPPMPESIEPLPGEETEIVGSDGAKLAKAFVARWQGEFPTYMPLDVPFTNHLNLVGFQSNDLEAGSPLELTLYWQPAQRLKRDVELFVQLYDRNRDKVVVNDHSWPLFGVFRIRAWQPEEIMPLSYSLPIPDDLPPGPYHLNVGIFDVIAHERVPLVTGRDTHLVKTFKIPLPKDDRLPDISTGINFGNIIELSGYSLTPVNGGLKLTLFWRALASPEIDYTSFVHIVDSDGKIVSQSDVEPLDGRYPTSIWSPKEVIVDERIVSSIPDGEYQIYIGWYWHQEDGWQRLSTVAQGGMPATDHVLLDTIILP